jgi:hypothetical protein
MGSEGLVCTYSGLFESTASVVNRKRKRIYTGLHENSVRVACEYT